MKRFFARLSVNLVRACGKLSPQGRDRLATVLAQIGWVVMARRRQVTLRNLELCLPELDESSRRAIAKSLYQRLARSILDHGVLWSADKETIQRYVQFEGLEHLLNNPEHQATILVSPHFVGLDAAGIALNTYVRGVSLYQKQSIPEWDQAFFEGRKRFSDPILIAKSPESDLRPVIRAMKEGLPFYYLPDMDHGEKNSIFLPFFGVTAATLPMVSRLARVTKARVLWCIATMTETGYRVIISQPWDNFPTADYTADTLRINQELETWVRAYPDQYFWVHRRFKTRPQGEPSVY